MKSELINKFGNKNGKIGIVGLGYVGLPLMLRYNAIGFDVLGIDIDQSKFDALLSGKSYIEHIPSSSIQQALTNGFDATTDFSRASECDALILCVPTPLNKYREPDLSFVIDTTEALVVTGQRADAGENVWAVPYDYEGACVQAPDICLGVNYFNWGPEYLIATLLSLNDDFTNEWVWSEPNWNDLNNHDTSPIGFIYGDGLTEKESGYLAEFINELAGGLKLFTGPLNFGDGSIYLAGGQEANELDIWYTPQLLEGIDGSSE